MRIRKPDFGIAILSLVGFGSIGFAQVPEPKAALLKQATAGDAEAQHQIGTDLREGLTGKIDPKEAAQWFRKAAEQGHACACYDLGMCYATGAGVPVNIPSAIEWFQKASLKGNAEANMNLGVAYHEGMGVQKDLIKATEYFQKAAMAGQPSAMLNLGIAYAKGEGIRKDRAEGFQWFLRAEASGEEKAKDWITFLRKEGFGTSGVENGTGIIHGPNHAYFIQAPKGWVLDNSIWADRGIFAVFYPADKPFQESPLIGYTMIQEKAPGGIEAHIKADMVHSLKGSASAQVERRTPLKTQDGREALVFTLQGVKGQDAEWMAYIDAPTVVILVSVSVRDPKLFSQGQQLLEGLVSSIGWFSDKVQYGKQ